MYQPAHFSDNDSAHHRALVAAHPLAMLITRQNGQTVVDHIPLQFAAADPATDPVGGLRLEGHVARANPLWKQHDANEPVIAVFAGPAAYISPSLYATKALTGEVVPTYNYAVIHVHGQLVIHDDVHWVGGLVRRLTNTMEAGRTPPWAVDDAPQAFIERQLGAIVGIEIAVVRIEAKYKLSQNRNAADKDGVVRGLSAGTAAEQAAAAMMTK